MPKALEILILVLAPLAWGLLVDFVFERVRRRRKSAPGPADDEVVE